MTDKRTGKDLKDISILEEPMIYVYIMLNSNGKVKIGKTKDIYKRYLSLCGSNSQGNEITDVFVSPCTYINTLETIMHDKFAKYRIPKTEWFHDKSDPDGTSLFYNAIKELELLFSSDDYKRCNDLRKSIYKGGDSNDH